MGFPGVDLILPCLAIALTNTQVVPIDGALIVGTGFEHCFYEMSEFNPNKPDTINM